MCVCVCVYEYMYILGSSRLISTSSWRDGQKLVKKILGPAPKIEQKERRTVSSDRNGRERTTKSGK